MFTVMVVRVSDPDDPTFEDDLAQQISRNRRFFENAPVVLDLKGASGLTTAEEFERTKAVLRRQKLVAAGIQNGTTSQRSAALDAGLGSFFASQPRSLRETLGHNGVVAERLAPQSAPLPPAPAPAAAVNQDGARGERSKIVTQPVRSGTQIYARGADLIITASVSQGAEVIADGNVHVYGSLRGRAIAGASGDTEARIFVSRLEAELVSVAGHYLVSESIDATMREHPVQVALVDDRLTITKN